MPSFLQFTLDTLAPAGVVLTAPANSATLAVSVSLATTDTPTTGYTMKLWSTGATADAVAGTTEANAPVLAYTTANKTVTFATDGAYTLNGAVYDDVGNRTATTASINVVTTLATVTVSGITGGASSSSRFSTTPPYDSLQFSFTSNQDYTEWKVLQVSTTGSTHDTGTAIGTANGSINVSGTASVTAGTPKSVTVKTEDLPTLVNELKTIKVFVKNLAGNWSQA